MNKFRTLTRVLFKNGAMPGRTGGTRNKAAWLIVAGAFLLLLFMEAFALWNAFETIAFYHLTGTLLASLLTAACIAMVLFGILYVISTYYFADDTLMLLTMPIPPYRILAAKFTVVLLFQYCLEILIVLPGLIVFGIRSGNFFYWMNAVLVFAVLPLIPTVVCSMVSILIMAFSRFFRNKDRVKFLAGLIAIVFVICISFPLQMLGVQTSPLRALQSSGGMMEKAVLLFPSNILAAQAVSSGTAGSFLWLLTFLLLSAAAMAIFLLLGNKLYLRGVVGLSQSNVNAKKAREDFRIKKHPAALAIALKDWRLLCRTPAYSLNCLLSAFLVPFILVVTFVFSLRGITVPRANALVISVGVLFLTFTSMTNAVSPTAVSRDGRDSALARLLPVRPETQIFGKLLPGLGLSFAALLVTAVPICILYKPDSFTTAAICGLSAIALITSNMLGLFFDIAFPKLDWDDETLAVKQNFNVIAELLVMLVVLGLPVIPIYKLHLSLQSNMIFLLIYNLALLASAGSLLFRKGSELYGTGRDVKAVKKTAGRQKTVRIAASIIVVIIVIGLIGWETFLVHTDVKIVSTEVTVSAGLGESSSFDLLQIKTVYLKNALPSVSGRVGYASGTQLRGSFDVAGLGRGHVYTETAKGPFLFVILKDGSFTIFNFSDTSKTEFLYHAFQKHSVKTS